MKKIVLLTILLFSISRINAQSESENVTNAFVSIVELISDLDSTTFDSFVNIATNPLLTTTQKQTAMAPNNALASFISNIDAQITILSDNNFMEPGNGELYYHTAWTNLETPVWGQRPNVSCAAYNEAASEIGWGWMFCCTANFGDPIGIVGCSIYALNQLEKLDKQYPSCANGRNRSGSAYPIIPKWVLNCENYED